MPDPDQLAPANPLRSLGLSREELLDLADALDVATRGIAGILSFERVLQLIVDRVRELVDAEYAALGIVDSRGVLERFVTSGLSREARERIGPLPRGHGLLGLIIHESRLGPDPGHRPSPAQLRLPAPPPADALVPRRPDQRSRARPSATST